LKTNSVQTELNAHKFLLIELTEFIHAYPDTPITEIFPEYLPKEVGLEILRNKLHNLQDELSNIIQTEGHKNKRKRTLPSSASISGPENDSDAEHMDLSRLNHYLIEPTSHTDNDSTTVTKKKFHIPMTKY
jgi:hypothetical protein